jgi:FkbM family methyltransferase
MQMNVKQTVKAALERRGYHVMKLGPQTALNRLGYHAVRVGAASQKDPYYDQRVLLGKRDVEVIFDVGANVGRSVERYRECFPAARTWCFEPSRESYGALVERFRGVKEVRAWRMAVGEKSGTVELFLNRNAETNSILAAARESGGEDYENVGREEVPCVALDDFCREHGVERINILKMDIQGAELMALRGAGGLLSRGAIDVIYSEVLFKKLYEGQCHWHEIGALLGGYGYRVFGLYGLRYDGRMALSHGDAIFVSGQIEREVVGNGERVS